MKKLKTYKDIYLYDLGVLKYLYKRKPYSHHCYDMITCNWHVYGTYELSTKGLFLLYLVKQKDISVFSRFKPWSALRTKQYTINKNNLDKLTALGLIQKI